MSNLRRWSLAGVVTIALLGCRSANENPVAGSEPALSDQAAPIDSTRLGAAIYQSLYRIGTTRREVRAELGAPITTRVDTVSNRHVEVIDSVFIWTYEGLEFQFYWATPVEREMLLKTTAAATHPRVARFSEPVRSLDTAQRRLGQERFRDIVADTTRLYFPVTEQIGADDTLILSYVGGQLVRVAIAPYID